MKQFNSEIIRVIKYFSIFTYYPTSKEIHTFLQAKISKNSLEKLLDKMIEDRKIKASKNTPPQYSIGKKISNNKYKISVKKLTNWRFQIYVKLASMFPQIRLIGLSGSISMMNAKEDDDIDLFIITAKNRLFTGRLITLVLAQMLGLRRSIETRSLNFFAPVGTLPAGSGESQVAKNFNSSPSSNNRTMKQFNNDFSDKVCLNLFFDERELKIPKFKQTVFVGHEVLQMKPIINKNHIYERFLETNKWVFKLFPNATFPVIPAKAGIQNKSTGSPAESGMTQWIEGLLKKFQMRSINKHKTTEIITNTQLWFHPDDFEKKLRI